jgi:hypothetical protein
MSEVVRRALATYELVVERTRMGDRLILRREGGEDVTVIVV